MTRQIDIAGPAGGPPLVLLHGAGANRRMWYRQVRDLSDEYRVIAPDLPGHGQHPMPKFRYDDAVADVQRLIDEEAGGSALVLGLSGGGYVGIGVAHDSPERVRALVLSGSTAEYLGWGGLSTRLFGIAVKVIGPLVKRKNEEAIRTMAGDEVADGMAGAGLSMRAASQSLLSLPGRDYHAMLEGFGGPILILNGERDKVNRESEDDAARRWNASLVVIPDSGHSCVFSQPEAFTAAARRFLRQHTAPS